MSSRNGTHRSRPPHKNDISGGSNTTAEKSQQGPSFSSTQVDRKDEGQTAATSSAEAENFAIIQAILSSRNNPRLDSVQRLLKNVVSGAATVVRGTDSQRRFNSTFTEFCISSMRCMADLEDAVFEHTHPGRRAADARDDEIDGVAEDFFLKQVAAYVATHTKTLGLAYLEHIALGALEKHQQQQRKRERTGGSGSGGAQRASKTSRMGENHSRTGGGRGAGGGGNHIKSSGNSGLTVADGARAICAFDSLGLIDAQDTMREALQIIEQEKNATAASNNSGNSRRRGPQAVTAGIGRNYRRDHSAGFLVSKAASSSSAGGTGGLSNNTSSSALTGDQVVYDLRNPLLKLSSIPELSTRLQPWTIPLSSSGVYLERVAMDRERKGAGSGSHASTTATITAGVSAGNNHNNSAAAVVGGSSQHASHAEPTKTTLDVCLAQTPMELLRLYEARETMLAGELQVGTSAGPYSVVPYAGKRGVIPGGSPRPTAAPFPSPLSLSAPTIEINNGNGGALPDTDAFGNFSADADGLAGGGAFFPAVRENKALTCLPQFVISNLSHLGVSRMEFVYTMEPASKQP